MKRHIFPGLLMLVLFSSCLNNDDASPSGCYPNSYSSAIGSTVVSEYYEFDSKNKLSEISTNTLTLKLTYDASSLLVKVNYSDGRVGNYQYDANKRLISNNLTSAVGTVTSKTDYSYNASGQLIKRQPFSLSNGVLVKNSYSTYEYPSSTTRNFSKRLNFSSTDILQSTETFMYDARQNPELVLTPNIPTVTTNNPTQRVFTPALGTVVTYTYTYQYSAKGYPFSYTIAGSNSFRETRTYEYNNCLN
jgi:uncharacterized protein RhaS with RHS repeats